jgi:hypothetical protein
MIAPKTIAKAGDRSSSVLIRLHPATHDCGYIASIAYINHSRLSVAMDAMFEDVQSYAKIIKPFAGRSRRVRCVSYAN